MSTLRTRCCGVAGSTCSCGATKGSDGFRILPGCITCSRQGTETGCQSKTSATSSCRLDRTDQLVWAGAPQHRRAAQPCPPLAATPPFPQHSPYRIRSHGNRDAPKLTHEQTKLNPVADGCLVRPGIRRSPTGGRRRGRGGSRSSAALASLELAQCQHGECCQGLTSLLLSDWGWASQVTKHDCLEKRMEVGS